MPTTSASDEILTVTYFLVLLVPDSNHAAASDHFAEHVAFIETMTAANVVLLGGDFESTLEGAEGAYLLHVETQEAAQSWTARDPLIRAKVYRPKIIPWRLVGIALDAADSRLTG
jgi:uncharacterized protein YciI